MSSIIEQWSSTITYSLQFFCVHVKIKYWSRVRTLVDVRNVDWFIFFLVTSSKWNSLFFHSPLYWKFRSFSLFLRIKCQPSTIQCNRFLLRVLCNLLPSTLQYFYDKSCINAWHTYLPIYSSMNITALKSSLPNNHSIHSTIKERVDSLMREQPCVIFQVIVSEK